MLRTFKKTGTKNKYVNDLDRVFAFYIRLRDAIGGGYTRCISCGLVKPFDKMDAGHYWSRKHMATRWHPLNVNSECNYCNRFDENHLFGYRENLIKKIGKNNVDYLDYYHNSVKKWSDFELVELIKSYGQEVLSLSEEKRVPVAEDVLRIIKRYNKK